MRRAARLGDGWMHAGSDDLEQMLRRLTELRKEYGRERAPFEIHVISLEAYNLDGIRRLEDLGVTDVIVGFRNPYVEADRLADAAAEARPVAPVRRHGDRQGLGPAAGVSSMVRWVAAALPSPTGC